MAEQATKRTRQGQLFRKYVVVFVVLVSGALLTSGLIEIYFSYQEQRAALVQIQREKADGAAQTPTLATTAPLDERRYEYVRLLRRAPAITEVSYLDATGHEQLRV